MARNVQNNLTDFYEKMKKSAKQDKYKQPRARLIILDRAFDLAAPSQHDYAYQSLVYDIKADKDGKEKIELDVAVEDQNIDEDKAPLDEKDEVWTRFK